MHYTYRYPNKVQSINGRRFGRIHVSEDHLAGTHNELMQRLGSPEKTIAVQVEIDAPSDRVWKVAAGSVTKFYAHHPVFAGLTQLNSLGSDEGGRFVVHRAINGCIFDRIGEVMISIPESQFTVSDVEIVDASVSGFFPSFYTVKFQEHPENSKKTIVLLTYTMLGVAHPWALAVLAYQANSIKYHSELEHTPE